MEFGQSLSFLNACVAIGFTVFAPLAGYQRQAYDSDRATTVSSENNPKTSSAESSKSPATTEEKSKFKIDKGGLEAVAPETAVAPESSRWSLLPFADSKKPSLIEKAYLDALTILKEDNSCSRFYGGSSAIGGLNGLVRRLTPTHLDRLIAVRMKGETSHVRDYLTGRAFRLFQKTEVNLSGPFFRGNTSLYEARIPFIGSFPPNTREARVTILLHELGHVLSTADKQWVLPDDGDDTSLSRKNTGRVIDACRYQITQVSHMSFERELIGARPTQLQNRER